MYSMVLVASLATAGDAPAFGKKDNGGCNGAGCAGVVVVNGGCNGCDGGRAGFLGLCGRHKNKGHGCNGGTVVYSGCYGGGAGCYGSVPVVAGPVVAGPVTGPVVMPMGDGGVRVADPKAMPEVKTVPVKK